MSQPMSRRHALLHSGALLGGVTVTHSLSGEENAPALKPTENRFKYCLNTSTVRGHKLNIVQQIELASQSGYDALEPWIRDISTYQQSGGSLKELKQRLVDANLSVESAIGFSHWIVDDLDQRIKGLEQAKREMDLLSQIGAKRMAAPPAGATGQSDLDLFEAAKRYRYLLEMGDEVGVVPQVEVWGFSKSLSRLGESMFVAIESGHPKACLLPDVYHIYKGGSDFAGLQLLSASAVQVFHLNDYPRDPPRDTIRDSDRVYPGDGVAPLNSILKSLHHTSPECVLSLELFNPTYWKEKPDVVAKTGLMKMKNAVNRALQ